MHIKNMFEGKFPVGIGVFKHWSSSAAGAFHGKNAPQEIRRRSLFKIHGAKVRIYNFCLVFIVWCWSNTKQ
jgi:hypothetical protein